MTAALRIAQTDVTPDRRLAAYIAAAADAALPAPVAAKTRIHLLDTLVAIISGGTTLPPGMIAYRFARDLGGRPEATLLGSSDRVAVVDAALANGMAGHADETDDSHLGGRFHPGCAVIPAALALAERDGASSDALLRAVALGYDVGARATMALGYPNPKESPFATHALGGQFGAAAAAGAILRLDEAAAAASLSYIAQQASGLPYWNRDPDHIEKAFDFGGKGARDGVYAALMAKAGFTAPADPLTGERGYLTGFAVEPRPEALADGLGERFEILAASIKKWTVGSPIQAVMDACEALLAAGDLRGADIAKVEIAMPSDRFHIINDRAITTISVQHLAAVILARGRLGYHDAHDESLADAPDVRALRAKVAAHPDDALAVAKPARQAIVEITLADGATRRHHTRAVRGTPDNPMTPDEVAAKARDILGGAQGGDPEPLIALCLEAEAFSMTALTDACRRAAGAARP